MYCLKTKTEYKYVHWKGILIASKYIFFSNPKLIFDFEIKKERERPNHIFSIFSFFSFRRNGPFRSSFFDLICGLEVFHFLHLFIFDLLFVNAPEHSFGLVVPSLGPIPYSSNCCFKTFHTFRLPLFVLSSLVDND